VPGYEFNGWVGIVAPAGTPAAIIKILNDSITRAVKSPEIIDKFNKDGAEVIASSPEQFKKLISDEVIQWSKVIKQAGIKVVLNTGYNRATAENLLGKLGWAEGQQIDLLVTASDVLHNRPMPDMILYAKDKLSISDTNHMVKIGDSCIDIEEGKNAGCLLNIGITTGAQTEIQLMEAKPDYIVHSLTEMLEILEK
jgi:phosphonatase-like hydrolase